MPTEFVSDSNIISTHNGPGTGWIENGAVYISISIIIQSSGAHVLVMLRGI